jgi:hypothetical protein
MQHSFNGQLRRLMNTVKDAIYYKLPEKTKLLRATLDSINSASSGIRYSLKSSGMHLDTITNRQKYHRASLKEKLAHELDSKFDTVIAAIHEFIEKPETSSILDSAKTFGQRRQALEKVAPRAMDFFKERVVNSSDAASIFKDSMAKFLGDIENNLKSLCSEIDGVSEVYDRFFEKRDAQPAEGRMIEKVGQYWVNLEL